MNASPEKPVEISAGRLHLRPWEPRDAAAVYAACRDAGIARWTMVPSPYRLADAEAFVGDVSARSWREGSGAPFAVLDAADGRLLASVSLDRVDDGLAEVGFWCVPTERGRGVVPQAVGALSRWGFGALGLTRVTWLAEVGNNASRRVADKASFTFEGTLRGWLPVRGGGRVDAWVGSLLVSDGVLDTAPAPHDGRR